MISFEISTENAHYFISWNRSLLLDVLLGIYLSLWICNPQGD